MILGAATYFSFQGSPTDDPLSLCSRTLPRSRRFQSCRSASRRIGPCRFPRRRGRCQECRRAQHRGRRGEGDGVQRGHAEEQRRQGTRQRRGAEQARRTVSDGYHADRVAEHEPHDVRAARTERHADAELAPSLLNRESEKPGDTHGGDDQRQGGEERHESGAEPRLRRGLRRDLVDRPHLREREVLVHACHCGGDCRLHRRRRHQRPYRQCGPEPGVLRERHVDLHRVALV